MAERSKENLVSDDLLNVVTPPLGALIAIYHLTSAFVVLLDTTSHYIVHLACIMVFGFILKLRGADRARGYLIFLLLLLTIVPLTYLFANVPRLEGQVEFISNTDLIMGILLLVPLFAIVYLFWGWVIPAFCLVGLLYFMYGHLVPGPLQHPEFSIKFVMSYVVTSLNRGVFGQLLPISANLIFYFMMLGGVMQGMGVVPSFMELGKLVGRILRGGPAWAAVLGSSLVAMISGSGSSNVILTGTMTIPAMKSYGFTPEEAASIEASASCGGQVTPPVMGAGAFIMASFLGVSYVVVMGKAILGALLYFFTLSIGIYIFCYARQKARYVGAVDKPIILKRFPIFLIPLLVLIVLVMLHYSLAVCTSVAILLALFLGLILIPENRSLKVFTQALAQGTGNAAQVGVLLGLLGPAVTGFITSGLAPKLTRLMLALTGGLLIPSLLFLAMVTILLGMGVPVSAAYIIVAILVIPSLWTMGIDMVASHFFAFYFAVWGAVSPPVAPSALVASRVADSNFWITGYYGMRWLICLFLFPFAIVLHPSLLNFPNYGWGDLALIGILLLISLLTAIALYSWFISSLKLYERALTALAAISLAVYILTSYNLLLIAGGILVAIFLLSLLPRTLKSSG